MNGIISETRLWHRDICGKTINFSSWLRPLISKTQKKTKKYGNVVEEYEYITPEIDEKKCIVKDTTKHCRNKIFHSFEYRCVDDIKFIFMENNEEVILTIIIGYIKFKSQFYGLKLKNQKCVEKWISF